MEDRQQKIESFFDAYADRFNKALKGETPDIDGAVAAFASCFISAGPAGVQCGKNDEQFRTVVPQGYDFYKAIGVTSMSIRAKEVTLLDGLHAMAKIFWRTGYEKKDSTAQGHIDFEVIYLVQQMGDSIKIFAYITGDEQKALQEHGLI